MRTTFLLVILSFLAKAISAQNSELQGNLNINMAQAEIEGNYQLKGFKNWNGGITFLLNDKIEISNVQLDGEKVTLKSTSINCFDCTIHTVIVNGDWDENARLSIDVKGRFPIYNADNKNTYDYKGLIAFNYGILRASEQAKWYPVLVDDSNVGETVSFAKRSYDYDIGVTCSDCKSVYIGAGTPQTATKQEQMRFKSGITLDNIMLIAGDYEWGEADNLVTINIPELERAPLMASAKSIMDYYGGLLKKSITQRFTIANCPSDKQWAFLTYPTIVFTRKKFQSRNATNTLSHEIAHYYFGNLYPPKSNLFWFYLESFSEYFSYKYQLSTGNVSDIKRNYNFLKKLAKVQWIPFFKRWKGNDLKFIKLHKVKKMSQVHAVQRYLISPFQLLGVEHEIGEAKMMEWIPMVFSKIEDGENGYTTMLESFEAIGVSKEKIEEIESKYFKRLKMRNYKFVESL